MICIILFVVWGGFQGDAQEFRTIQAKTRKGGFMRELRSAIALMTAAALICTLVCGSAIASETKTKSKKPGIGKFSLVSAVAMVESIDAAKRIVTLKRLDGDTISVKVQDLVDLSKVKAGDEVAVKYYESVEIRVKKPAKDEPKAEAAEVVAVSKPGEMPAKVAVTEVIITATIEAIDKENQTATLKGPKGNTKVVQVKNPKNLEAVSVGDEVEITLTEALAISVEKPEK
jgi:hypothetical protein